MRGQNIALVGLQKARPADLSDDRHYRPDAPGENYFASKRIVSTIELSTITPEILPIGLPPAAAWPAVSRQPRTTSMAGDVPTFEQLASCCPERTCRALGGTSAGVDPAIFVGHGGPGFPSGGDQGLPAAGGFGPAERRVWRDPASCGKPDGRRSPRTGGKTR